MSGDSGLDIGRRRKSARIAEAIRELGGGAHEARQLTDAEWLDADNVSRRKALMRSTDNPPSMVIRALVIERLDRREPPEVDTGEPEG